MLSIRKVYEAESVARILTHGALECFRLALPCNEYEVNGNAGEDHQAANAGLNGTRDHRNNDNKSSRD